MRLTPPTSIRAVIAGMVLALFGAAVSAQRPAAPRAGEATHFIETPARWVHPKTAWGDPDLQGMWPISFVGSVPLERCAGGGRGRAGVPPCDPDKAFLTEEEYQAMEEVGDDWFGSCSVRQGESHMRYALALPVVLALLCSACGNSTSPTSPTPSNTSTLTVSLKDSPFSDAKALLVTFSTVTAHRTGGDFSTLPFSGGASSRTCDLKKLTTATDVLGTGALPTGHYTMLRLVVSSAAIYFDNPSSGTACAPAIAAPAGRSAAVDIPSGEVRLNREFDLTTSNARTILLDFDGDQSVRQTGNGQYMMTPVIAIVSVQ